jgi:protein-tyrosine phosphatase
MPSLRSERAKTTCQLDASRIVRGLYQGSKPPVGGAVRRCDFDLLVLCAMEYQPPAEEFPGIVVWHAPLDDAQLSRREWKLAVEAARLAAEIMRAGGRVLSTCQAGRNRSGLVSALTLHLLTREPGEKIVNYIQRKRNGALTNPSFVAALNRL